jgi:TPM domain
LPEFAEKIQVLMFCLRHHIILDFILAESCAKRRRRLVPRCVLFFLGALLPLLTLGGFGFAERPFPKPQGLVNDYAEVIPERDKTRIGAVVSELLQKTQIPVVVATMPEIGGAEYNDYVNRLYSAWGIGKKGEDQGSSFSSPSKNERCGSRPVMAWRPSFPTGLGGKFATVP